MKAKQEPLKGRLLPSFTLRFYRRCSLVTTFSLLGSPASGAGEPFFQKKKKVNAYRKKKKIYHRNTSSLSSTVLSFTKPTNLGACVHIQHVHLHHSEQRVESLLVRPIPFHFCNSQRGRFYQGCVSDERKEARRKEARRKGRPMVTCLGAGAGFGGQDLKQGRPSFDMHACICATVFTLRR